MSHKIYFKIFEAINKGILQEPFCIKDLIKACPDFGDGTYKAFLYKHREGNPGGNSELFIKISPGKFRCIRPFKYINNE